MEITLNRSLSLRGPNIGTRTIQLGGNGAWKWDISTISSAGTFNASANGGLSTQGGLQFNEDGTKMFCGDNSADGMRQWTLSTPWDVTTATFDIFRGWNNSYCTGMQFKPGGETVIDSHTSNQVYEHTLNTPYDLVTTGISYVQVKAIAESIGQLNINALGTKAIAVQRYSTGIFEYSMSTGWDISTLTKVDTANDSLSFQGASYVSNDGLHLIALMGSTLKDYALSSEYTISGLSEFKSAAISSANSVYVNESLGILYTLDIGENVRQYTMSEL